MSTLSMLILGQYNLSEDLPMLKGICICSDLLGTLIDRAWFVSQSSLSSDNNPTNMRDVGPPTVSTPPGCKAHPLGKSYLGWFYLIMATECIRHSTSDWISQLYKNVLGAINVLFIAIDVPQEYKHMFAFPARVLNSIFGNRVMLLLVEHRHRTLQNNLRYRSGDQDFSSTNMGISFTTVGHDVEVTGKDEVEEPWMSEGEWIT
ncbi:hypothetical protein K443DRAFT_135345 [Laccaria amethystina LaAM-08-1]|uniref:Uncharacterized protein n=1 Tax=Laccaria amethystina LaAM-08-1 TaxID=1095629 RepID=A0A0C9X6Y1_9AGAR|nr:hypothetical protein K443DRAFT_135345 [Laccaria amethystina LaAM-08-1]